MNRMTERLPIDDVIVKDRLREQHGDIAELAESITDPIEVLRNHMNIYGAFLSSYQQAKFIVAMKAIAEDEIRKTRPSWVYFAAAGGYVKIGVSRDPATRLTQITPPAGGLPKLEGVIAGGFTKEKELHKHFAHLRAIGEWFYLTGEICTFVKENRLTQEQIDAIAERKAA